MTTPRYTMAAPDGLYDNRSLMRREKWTGGRVSWVTARHLTATRTRTPVFTSKEWLKPWGLCPDTPPLTPTPTNTPLPDRSLSTQYMFSGSTLTTHGATK